MNESVRFLACGDTALVVEFGNCVDRALSERVLRLRDRIVAADIDGVHELVPTFRSLMIHYEPLAVCGSALEERLGDLLDETPEPRSSGRTFDIPVCYATELAPDLEYVAQQAGLSQDDVVELHASQHFHVYMVGFLPGYPYMGDLPEPLRLSRRQDPRIRIPPGSVSIAAEMTAIYPVDSPGGWHLIGNTPVRLFNPNWTQPALLAPGDHVQFRPVSMNEFTNIKTASETDAAPLQPREPAA